MTLRDLPIAARRRTLLLAALCGGAASSSPLAGAAEAAHAATLPMPPPSRAVIVRWDSLGGLRAQGDPDQPALLLHADGHFSAPAAHLGGPRRTGQLNAAQLNDLLNDILVKQRFADINVADIQTEMRQIASRSGRLLRTMDGGTTRIEVLLPGRHHRVEMPNLHSAHRNFPEIDSLLRLHTVQQRLLDLATTAR